MEIRVRGIFSTLPFSCNVNMAHPYPHNCLGQGRWERLPELVERDTLRFLHSDMSLIVVELLVTSN